MKWNYKKLKIEDILYIIMMIPLFLAISNGITDKEPVKEEIKEEISFDSAFKDARDLSGPWGLFMWNGKEYNTLYKEEE